jgi:geranylgeranyl reductase family protein
MTDFDVAVVGAGPAGSWAAYKLARDGVRVALIDGTHPREKPCGGGVTGRALAIVRQALGDDVPGATVRSATFARRAEEARIWLNSADAAPLRIVARQPFDGALRAAALEAGTEPISHQITDVQPDRCGWVIRLRERQITAGWLIGADGANSLVRRRVALPFSRAQISIAAGYYVPHRTTDEIVIAFEDTPPGYLWSFPRVDHLAIGTCAQADAASSRALLAVTRGWIERKLGIRVDGLPRYSWPIPSLDLAALKREQSAGPRWMLIGDAAGLVDPITREGIFFALESADVAASSLLAGGDSAAAYERVLRSTIFEELARASRLKAMFFQPAFTALLVRALQRSEAIRAVMADLVAGRQTYQGLRRRLVRTWEFGLMLDLLRQRHV